MSNPARADKPSQTREVLDTLRDLGVSQASFARFNRMHAGTISRWSNHLLFEDGQLTSRPSRRTGDMILPHHQAAPYWAVNMVRMLKTGVQLEEARKA